MGFHHWKRYSRVPGRQLTGCRQPELPYVEPACTQDREDCGCLFTAQTEDPRPKYAGSEGSVIEDMYREATSTGLGDDVRRAAPSGTSRPTLQTLCWSMRRAHVRRPRASGSAQIPPTPPCLHLPGRYDALIPSGPTGPLGQDSAFRRRDLTVPPRTRSSAASSIG